MPGDRYGRSRRKLGRAQPGFLTTTLLRPPIRSVPVRLHLIGFHGVLAPNARLRPEIIPNVPVNVNTPQRTTLRAPPAAPAPMSWARLLKRVFEIDMEHGSRCGGTLTSSLPSNIRL
jgi:hypothetical protein